MVKKLIKMMGARWWILLAILASSFTVVVSTAYVPIYLGECYQLLEDGEFLFHPFLMLSVGYLLRAIFKLVRNHLTVIMGTGLVRQLRGELCDELLYGKAITDDTSVYAYSLLSYEIETIANIVSYRPFSFLENVMILVWSFVRVAEISGTLLICIVPTLIVTLLVGFLYGKSIRKSIRQTKQSVHRLSDLVMESMTCQKVIRSLSAQTAYEQKFDDESDNNRTWNLELARKTRIATPMLELISYIARIIAVAASGIISIQMGLPSSLVVTISSYMIILGNLATKLPDNVLFFVDAGQSLKRIQAYFDDANETRLPIIGSPSNSSIQEITFHNVTAHVGTKSLWSIPHLSLKRGQLTVIDGESGSGKTIFCDILSGLSTHYTGQIHVNGQPLQNFDLKWYHQQLGYALQQTMIFFDTVKNNITMGRSAEKEWEEKLLRLCNLTPILERLNHTEIHGDSNFLSGGERQRIGIARAMYQRPQLLILDDVFTALDELRRHEICDFLSRWKEGRILVIVSSYPEVLAQADQILHLTEG